MENRMYSEGELLERIDALGIPFGRHGYDPYGVDRRELLKNFKRLNWMTQKYFKLRTHGTHNIPKEGRGMLVGNHSGGFGLDGGMVIASAFFDLEPPRLAQGMADKFIGNMPFMSALSNGLGQFTGLPEHAERLLQEDRLLMVFPEGHKGTAKLYKERDTLVNFGSGFLRLALSNKAPIIPLAFVGGGEAVPTVMNLYKLGKALGVPYVPVTPWILAIPLPVRMELIFSEPMHFDGDGNEPDEVIEGWVQQVKDRIAGLLRQGRAVREGNLHPEEIRWD